jgi:DNA-damage-inducible protein D
MPPTKAEPFRRWLAKVGYERVQDIEGPKLASQRTRAIYKAKGYSDAWIEKRMRVIEVRAELTDEWKKRGVKEEPEYAILTADISLTRLSSVIVNGGIFLRVSPIEVAVERFKKTMGG